MTSSTAVKCGNCHGYHESSAAVRACHFPPPRPISTPGIVEYLRKPTEAQINFIRDLGGNVEHAIGLTRTQASIYINSLKRRSRPMSLQETAPNRKRTMIPIQFLKELPDGYYASRVDDSQQHTFFRVSRPKNPRNRFFGAIKIQTQHGPDYQIAMAIWADDDLTFYNLAVEQELLLVCVNINGTAIEYSRLIGRCLRCNTELTDERSRWFGIGPECEKHRPQIIDIVTEDKGPFVPGWE